MLLIQPLSPSDPGALAGAQRLWAAYLHFLRETSAHTACDVARLEAEIPRLPEPYRSNHGEVLLASIAAEPPAEPQAEIVGCIVYHACPVASQLPSCELKRLFVTPAARGQGIGEALVQAALERARQRGYLRACLDTAPADMAAAVRLYQRLGFAPFHSPTRSPGSRITDLERSLG